MNLFLYAQANPINAIDPYGLFEKLPCEDYATCKMRCLSTGPLGWAYLASDILGYGSLLSAGGAALSDVVTRSGTSATNSTIQALKDTPVWQGKKGLSKLSAEAARDAKLADNIKSLSRIGKVAKGSIYVALGATATGYGIEFYCSSQCKE